MSWWRRNWVDLLLVVLIACVGLGFLALVTRGAPLGFLSRPAPVPAPQAAPRTETVPGPATPSAPAPSPEVEELPTVVAPSPRTATSAAPRAATATPAAPAAPASRAATPTARAAAPRPAVTPGRVPTASDYRVSIGSYADAARAGRLAAAARTAGFPASAVPGSRGLTAVLVGPFDGEAEATTALRRLRATYGDAILYRPRAEAAARPAVPAPGASVYLQVGAFRTADGAAPLLQSLRGAGYAVTVRSSPDGYTRVLLGPVPESAVERIKTELRARDLSPFVSR